MALFATVSSDPLLQFFLQLALTLFLCRVLGKLFAYLQQPQVIGEIIAGILMGPSVMGHIPGYTQTVWPTSTPLGPKGQPYDSTVTFEVIADVGVVLFMFLLGCELDHQRMQRQWRHALPVAVAAIVVPFGVGAATSLWLESVNAEGQPPEWVAPRFRSFTLFIGAAMSFTAFPVLASVLTTMGLLQTPIGLQALSCAAVDDVLAWCTLALASSFAQSASALEGLYTCIGAVVYIGFMVGLLRPALGRLHRWLLRRGGPAALASPYYECFIFLLLIGSAFTTQGLGIHCFFGAFVMGIITPKAGGFAAGLASRMELVVTEVLLPLFFASSGIKTDIGTLDTARYWGIALCLLCIASAAKFTPVAVTTKLVLPRSSWRFCAAVGILMNTRGLVELIALNIGLSMGILSTRLFTLFVLMAIATTWITSPALHLLYRHRKHELLGDGQQDLPDRKSVV